jgi:hypothetical protein
MFKLDQNVTNCNECRNSTPPPLHPHFDIKYKKTFFKITSATYMIRSDDGNNNIEMRIWCIKIGIVLVLHTNTLTSGLPENRDSLFDIIRLCGLDNVNMTVNTNVMSL